MYRFFGLGQVSACTATQAEVVESHPGRALARCDLRLLCASTHQPATQLPILVIVPSCLAGDRYDGKNTVVGALSAPSVHLLSCRKIARRGNPMGPLHFTASVTTCNLCMAVAWGGVVRGTLWLHGLHPPHGNVGYGNGPHPHVHAVTGRITGRGLV